MSPHQVIRLHAFTSSFTIVPVQYL